MCVRSALLSVSAPVVPEAFHSPNVGQNSLTERDTITHCSDVMRYGELPALNTKDKCVYTVHVCATAHEDGNKKRLRVSWLTCLSQQGGATAN